MTEQILYRFYDENDQLIYVGITHTWYQRFHQHEKNSGWFSEAVKVTFERFPDRESVEQAELEIIQRERPAHNKYANPDYESTSAHGQKIRSWVFNRYIDDAHKPMADFVDTARDKFKWPRKSAKYAALIWFVAYASAKRDTGFECRNCEAYTSHRSYKTSAEAALKEFRQGAN